MMEERDLYYIKKAEEKRARKALVLENIRKKNILRNGILATQTFMPKGYTMKKLRRTGKQKRDEMTSVLQHEVNKYGQWPYPEWTIEQIADRHPVEGVSRVLRRKYIKGFADTHEYDYVIIS